MLTVKILSSKNAAAFEGLGLRFSHYEVAVATRLPPAVRVLAILEKLSVGGIKMASVHEADFAWITRAADPADAWRNSDGEPLEYLDSGSTTSDYDEFAVEEPAKLRLDNSAFSVLDDFEDAGVSTELTGPCVARAEILDSDGLHEHAPDASLPSTRKTRRRASFVHRLVYFGSSAFAALVATIVILRTIGVNLFELNGPFGLQPAIACFVEFVVLTSAAIAACADVRDIDTLKIRHRQKPLNATSCRRPDGCEYRS